MLNLKQRLTPFLLVGLLLTLQPFIVQAQDATAPGQIVYTYGDTSSKYRLHIMNADGSGDRAVDSNDVFQNNAQASPDGRVIAYLGNNRPPLEVFVVNADGSDMRQLTQFKDCFVPTYAWSPDSTRLAVAHCIKTGDKYSYPISFVNLDGTIASEIAVQVKGVISQIAGWSPDGKQLLLDVAMPIPTGSVPTVVVVNLDGSGARALTTESAADPDFSPDGSQIVYESFDGAHGGLTIMNADGSNPQLVPLDTSVLTDAASPAWSPDGKQIVFQGYLPDGTGNQLWVINVDGTGQKQLTFSDVSNPAPDWLPAATSIATPEATAAS